MNRILFLMAYFIIKIVSRLPFRVVYIISDIVCFFVFNILKYRRNVTQQNLAMALPNKSIKERKRIERLFYKHLCDMFLEMIMPLSKSASNIRKRYKFKNHEILKQFNNQSVILLGSHHCNWEWYNSFRGSSQHIPYAVYTAIQNKRFEKLIKGIRGAYGVKLLERKNTGRLIASYKKDSVAALYYFISDQSPVIVNNNHWTNFMGIKVPIFYGYERIAAKYDFPVLFLHSKKIKRGYYEVDFKIISKDPTNEPPFKIADEYTRLVENQIKDQPEYYLWTHKRWKHKDRAAK